ncbi:MAG: SCO family protein [Candidatus Zixiibacteriota bacterium]
MPPEQRVSGRIVILALAGLLVIAMIGAYAIHLSNRSRLALPVLGQVPEFTFTERSGETFGRRDLMGKISVVDFIFTRCPGICPIMSGRMSRLYRQFAQHREIQFVSISVDPDYDSLPVLRAYAERQGVTDNRWLFLRGPIDEVIQLSEKGFMLPLDEPPAGHSSKFVLVDAAGQIRGYYASDADDSQLLLQYHLMALSGSLRRRRPASPS